MLIENRKGNIPTGLTETHHILPRCLGGSDDFDNLVKLTPREHLISHLLLVKIYKHHSLIYSANMMTNFKKYNGRKYEWLKDEFFKTQSIVKKGNKNCVGRVISDETRKKISNSNKGRIQTDEHRQKNSDANKGEKNAMYGKTHTEESRSRIRESVIKHKESLTEYDKDIIKKKLSESQKKVQKTEDWNKKNSESTKKRWDNMTEEQKREIVEKTKETKRRKISENNK